MAYQRPICERDCANEKRPSRRQSDALPPPQKTGARGWGSFGVVVGVRGGLLFAPTTWAGACRRQIAACMRQPTNTDSTALPCPLNAKIPAGMAGGKVTLCHPSWRLAQGAGGLMGWWSGFVVASLILSAWRVLLQICIKFGKNMQHSRTLRKSYLEILVTGWLIAAFLQNGWKFHCQYYCTGISSFFAQIILIDIWISSRICWNQSFSPILVGRAT